MKTYIIQVEIEEGCDEYWEQILKDGKSGCDDILSDIKSILYDAGYHDAVVKLVSFEDR